MTWHDPSSPTLHTAASEAWAMISATSWQASWIDDEGTSHNGKLLVNPGATLSEGVLEHIGKLLHEDFPPMANLYIASPECMIAPDSYQGEAIELLHAVLDETIPAASVQTISLEELEGARLVFVCPPALSTIWKKIAPQGAVVPLAERDIHHVLSNEAQNLACIHVLPGYVQLTLKREGSLQLCNAFRYQEGEEAGLMSRAVIDQFFQQTKPEIHILHNSDSEASIASTLLSNIEGATAIALDQNYWI